MRACLASLIFVAIAAAAFGWLERLLAQPASKPARIGILHPGTARPTEPSRVTVLRMGLGELGYLEGHDFVLETRYAEGRPDRLAELADDLVRSRVDVTVASGFAIAEARKATTAIPIVMNFSGDPVGRGYVQSLARPGGNVTGVATLSPETTARRLEVLRELVPRADRIGYVSSLADSLEQRGAESAAQALGISFAMTASEPAEVDAALQALDVPAALIQLADRVIR